jgi:hypothetical protein
MRKFLLLTALLGFPFAAFTGCGGHGQTVVEGTQESDGSMNADQQKQYEEMMKSGQYGSSQRPGN